MGVSVLKNLVDSIDNLIPHDQTAVNAYVTPNDVKIPFAEQCVEHKDQFAQKGMKFFWWPFNAGRIKMESV